MSRIGRMPVVLPEKVKVEFDNGVVSVSGPKGSLKQILHPDMTIEQENGQLLVKRPSDGREHRSLHGLSRSLVNNMVLGVSEGFTRRLQVEGVGYRSEMKGSTLVLHVGFSHTIEVEAPPDVSYIVEDRGKTIIVHGIDKQVVGQIAANIRKSRPPEPYKGKGIRYEGEYVRRKAGKAGKV